MMMGWPARHDEATTDRVRRESKILILVFDYRKKKERNSVTLIGFGWTFKSLLREDLKNKMHVNWPYYPVVNQTKS